MSLDVASIKADFPILKRQVHGKRLVYLDSAATSQKPLAVLDAMDRYYREYNANVHRGVYTIAEEATAAFEAARAKVGGFVNAHHAHEIIYVRNATEAINLVAYSWARANLREGDPIVLTHMEHHANVVPWHILAAERGVELRWIPITDDYRLDLRDLDRLLDGAKLLSVERDVERARHDQRHPPARRRRPRRRRPRARRRVPGGAAPGGRRAGLGRRLRRLLRPQDVRADRHRGAVGPGRAPRGHAAVHGWRRDDHPGHRRRLHAQRGALEVRGGHAADRGGGRLRRRGRLRPRPRHGRHPRARARPHRVHARRAHASLRRQPHDLRTARHRGARRCDLVPLRGHPRARHLPGRRRGGRVRARRPPLRQAAHARARCPRHHPRVVLRLQRRSRRRRPHRRAARAEQFFAI